jgi:hypothetical protein
MGTWSERSRAGLVMVSAKSKKKILKVKYFKLFKKNYWKVLEKLLYLHKKKLNWEINNNYSYCGST